MRFMMIVKSDPVSEQQAPTAEDFATMGRYNESLRDAGILLALDGLASSKDGAKVTFDKGKTTVKDGPFTEAKELVAGFWIIQVRSKEEAIEWAKRIPFSHGESVEVRRVAEMSDFADIIPPAAAAEEEAKRAASSGKPN
jgi:hypothetical protein